MIQRVYSRLRGRYRQLYAARTRFVLDSIDATDSVLILGARKRFVDRVDPRHAFQFVFLARTPPA
ncbi:MAG: hypothetical protein EA398_15570 [Deltaproteobacteria bacterium]|nr:MAG: hypothetical protein EA398_15570 [Deltaproteobacteria bacterium]